MSFMHGVCVPLVRELDERPMAMEEGSAASGTEEK